jgi:hypothetical protein
MVLVLSSLLELTSLRNPWVREAASRGAPQARQIADRFHLQQNLAEALRGFFRQHEQVLKTVARQLAGTDPPSPKTPAARQTERDRRRRHAKRIALHKKIWKLFRAGQSKEEIARSVGVTSRSVYRALQHEQPPARERRSRTHPAFGSVSVLPECSMERGLSYSFPLV